MRSSRRIFAVAAASMALAAALGLAACSGQNEAQGAGGEAEATQAAVQGSTVEAYNLTSVWVGMGDDAMTYYFEGADQATGAVLVYYTADNAYERWVGAMEQGADGQKTITDAESGEALVFSVSAEDADGIVELQAANGFAASMSAMEIADVDDVLDTIGTYATKVGE